MSIGHERAPDLRDSTALKVGDLFKRSNTKIDCDEVVRLARLAFGHIKGRSDVECLCLRISQLERLARERLFEIRALHEKLEERE